MWHVGGVQAPGTDPLRDGAYIMGNQHQELTRGGGWDG